MKSAVFPGAPLTLQYGVIVWVPAERGMTAIVVRVSQNSWCLARLVGPNAPGAPPSTLYATRASASGSTQKSALS